MVAAAAVETRASELPWSVWRWLLTLAGLLCGLGLFGVQPALAHPMPESRVWVDTTPQGLRLTLLLPLSRLEAAYGRTLTASPARDLAAEHEGLARYLLQHVGARSDGQGWVVRRPTFALVGDPAAPELEAELLLEAPAGVSLRQLELLYDVIIHEVRTHRVQVQLRQDWAGGQAGREARPLGELHAERNSLALDLPAAQAGAAWRSLFLLGAQHIAEGIDHLLFLLTLLLAAPLVAASGRWAGVRPPRAAVRRLLAVVTAFTFGHSLTLAWGVMGGFVPPVTWVEGGVVLSIVAAAAHAWRPLLSGGEVLMATGFGLLHGLAFANTLSGSGLAVAQRVQALLAFNLGIEAVQLLIVLLCIPVLLGLATRAPRWYQQARRLSALLAVAAALFWGLPMVWAPSADGAGPESRDGIAPTALLRAGL